MAKTTSIIVLLLVVSAILAESVLRADSLVVPQSDTSTEGDINYVLPFNVIDSDTNSGLRYQQVYSAGEFAPITSSIESTQIAFRPDAPNGLRYSITLASIQIDLSTTTAAPDALNQSFDGLSELRDASKLAGWLCQIARNRFQDQVRKIARETTQIGRFYDAQHEARTVRTA